ncbi:hypothetical protein [Streptomyces sp. NBC_01171]|uniref:hypothetical protein n=1 Tax=Streptomyces sp. NBC_01171 TaxID=2903757 RepID=UPI0038650B50|nr:hypothetical protein OG448_02475 [Streptomyces sp. NBC_01171]
MFGEAAVLRGLTQLTGRAAATAPPRITLWIPSLGIFDKVYAHDIAGTGEQHAYPPTMPCAT